jgi:hypothetical protein
MTLESPLNDQPITVAISDPLPKLAANRGTRDKFSFQPSSESRRRALARTDGQPESNKERSQRSVTNAGDRKTFPSDAI